MKRFAEIRARCMAVLESTAALLQRAGTPLKSARRYLELAAVMRNELEKVRNLELRMAIVAPMKAGKSTIINAILGQGLLPTRNSAMTTLPCEIVCESVASPIASGDCGTPCRSRASFASAGRGSTSAPNRGCCLAGTSEAFFGSRLT
jgi:hypothetical protein